MVWFQRELELPQATPGFHPITPHIVAALPELRRVKMGLLHIFLCHTSASISINENADPDVPADLDRVLSDIAPESFPYAHTLEGPDDMPAHVKSSLLGCSLSVPIRGGKLGLGTWQGIYLCEHRRHGGQRRLILTVLGQAE